MNTIGERPRCKLIIHETMRVRAREAEASTEKIEALRTVDEIKTENHGDAGLLRLEQNRVERGLNRGCAGNAPAHRRADVGL